MLDNPITNVTILVEQQNLGFQLQGKNAIPPLGNPIWSLFVFVLETKKFPEYRQNWVGATRNAHARNAVQPPDRNTWTRRSVSKHRRGHVMPSGLCASVGNLELVGHQLRG